MVRSSLVALATLALAGQAHSQRMTTRDLLALPQPNPDSVFRYGTDSLQIGELFLPPTPSSARARVGTARPILVLIHGGCWLAAFNRGHIRQLARAIADRGLAVWSLEYRRVGDAGGGWPGTFDDIAAGVDFVRIMAPSLNIDTTRVLAAGHSAGGHLALWAASRSKLRESAPGSRNPIRLAGVVALAAVPDLLRASSGDQPICGDAISKLLGATRVEQPGRYLVASPTAQLPLRIPQTIITGADDAIVPPDLSRGYTARAVQAGDRVRLVVLPDAGHFEVVSPNTAAGTRVVELILEMAGVP